MKWSSSWKASKNPSKQRKYKVNAPLHLKQKLLGVHLSKELREKYKTRSIELRKGDKVKILKGNHKGKLGKISRIRITTQKVYIEGMDTVRKDGNKVLVPFKASNLMITELELSDKKRKTKIEKMHPKETK
ncbi:50S ribosomal protein L24 [Candidatus Woesearchaeota archaeon]|nr:50S ribosomal protein L24 [Candidatus Woesearchaeota archaeon]